MTITGDNPIRRPEEDTLGRVVLARSFVNHVLTLDVTEGAVVGVLGAWGSGKTSFLNLAQIEFEKMGIPLLKFNPWMFSGTEQLVNAFFVEIAVQLRLKPGLSVVGKGLEDYGEMFSGMVWLPVAGPWIERLRIIAKVLGKGLQRRKGGIVELKVKLEKALAGLNKPIAVVLDDIDRLSTSEIRDLFVLVRLTASFPNVIYLLAFDRVRVEEALTEDGLAGRDYIEKIIQVVVDLPVVAEHVLTQQIASSLDKALSNIQKTGPFDEQDWPDIFTEIIRPVIRNMRDVRRYTSAAQGTVGALDGKIALPDVLALEAIRVFLPDVFVRLPGAIEGLTTVGGETISVHDESPRLKTQIESLVKDAGKNETVVRAMVDRLFPAAKRHLGGSTYGRDWKGRWFKERRVAHVDIFRLYLERIAGEGLQTLVDSEKAMSILDDREALDGFLRSIEAARAEDVIKALENYEDEFKPEHVVPGTIVLLNLLDDLPKRTRGILEMSTCLVVSRVTYRLLRSLDNPREIEAAVRKILPQLRSLSAKLEVIDDVGYREGIGHKLVPAKVATELETAWLDEMRSASVSTLTQEINLLRILLIAKRGAANTDRPFEVDDAPPLTLAILKSAVSETLRQTMGSRAVTRSPRLAWEALIELYTDVATLRGRIENLKITHLAGSEELVKLAERYLGGWRPDREDPA